MTQRFARYSNLLAIAIIGLLISSPQSAWAGAEARISAKVWDAERKPVKKAKVVITNPKVPTFKKEIIADDDGFFRTILADSTYTYTYEISAEGYQTRKFEKKAGIGSAVEWEFEVLTNEQAKAGAGAQGGEVTIPESEKAKVVFNDGVGLLNLNDTAGAEKKFLEAVGMQADLLDGWRALTKIAIEKKDGAKALEYSKKALDLKEKELAIFKAGGDEVDETELLPFLNALATAQELSGDKGEAKKTRERMSRLAGDPAPLYNEAVEAFNKGQMKEAGGKLEKALELKEDYALAHYLLGLIQMNGGKNKDAKTHFQRYLELEPKGDKAEEVKAFLSYL